MKDEAKYCPNPDCGYISSVNDECPECGTFLKKVEGDDRLGMSEEDEMSPMPRADMTEFDDDPTAIDWGSEGSVSAM